MTSPFGSLDARAIVTFHDERIANGFDDARTDEGDPWASIATNHRSNMLLWDEEDQARRTGVPAAAIAANKRAIDGCNQRRNDAIERIDEALLARLAGVAPRPDAWHNSETAGSIVDRLSILALKIHHMRAQTLRDDASDEHVRQCREKLARLSLQRDDLARCFDTLLASAAAGRAFWRVYRQFKMYNDPTLNPYLYAKPK